MQFHERNVPGQRHRKLLKIGSTIGYFFATLNDCSAVKASLGTRVAFYEHWTLIGVPAIEATGAIACTDRCVGMVIERDEAFLTSSSALFFRSRHAASN